MKNVATPIEIRRRIPIAEIETSFFRPKNQKATRVTTPAIAK